MLKYIFSLVLFLAGHAQAGGPLSVCSGVPTRYAGAGTITLNYDQGSLGSRSKAQADALVTEAVSLWSNVSTATVILAQGSDLPVNVTAANYSSYGNNYSDGLNPVIYDTDGSIIDMLYGIGAKNSTLGFAGSDWYEYPTYCQYAEGVAVINGYITKSDTDMQITLAHEVGHLIGLDHTQLDNTQGLTSRYPSNYPLMYPIAYRDILSLHDDDAAAVSALYPDVNLGSVYGQLSGTFTQTGGTPIRGANLWAEETGSHQVFSIVSDYLMQSTGYFKLLLPAGTYTLHAEAVQTNFTGGSSVGPYAERSSDPSFQAPLYVGGVAMTPVTLGNGSPTQIAIIAGCDATAGFKLDGSGTVSGNCVATCSYTLDNTSQSAAATGLSGTISVSSTSGCAWTAASNAGWITIISGSSGSGNGIVVYAVVANTGSSSRSGTLTIAGQTFTVTQNGTGAAAAYANQVQAMYIAYFGRPADPGGLVNFEAGLLAAGAPTNIQDLLAAYNTNATIKSLVDGLGTSAESNLLYAGDTTAFVTAVFNSVLNRPPLTAGLDFWSSAIDNGGLTKGNAALSIMAGALANTSAQGLIDAALVNNKLLIGSNFTSALTTTAQVNAYSGPTAAATVRAMLATVDEATDPVSFQATITSTIAQLVAAAP